jgi:hypothetical protein
MQKRRRRVRDRFPLVMIGGLLLLGVVGAFVLKGAARGAFADRLSTFRSEPDGARALYLLAEAWQLPVSRGQQSFETIDEKQNLVLLAVDLSELSEKEEEEAAPQNPFFKPDGGFAKTDDDEQTRADDDDRGRYRAVEVSAKEREQLLAHLRGGATIVYLPWSSRENPLLKALDVHLWRADRELGLRTLEPSQPSPFTSGVERVEAKVHSYLDLPAGSIPLLQDSVLKEPVAGVVPYGQGHLVIIGAPHLAMNEALALADNARFWRSTLRAAAKTGPLVFDEFHHGFSGDRSIASFAARYGVQFAVAQLILAVCLWAAALRRFGRPKAPPEDVRVGGTDALFATSRLYREGRHHGHAASEIVRQLTAELSQRVGLPARSEARDVVEALKVRGRAALAAALADVHTRALVAASETDVLEVARRAAAARKLTEQPRRPAVV